MPYSNDVKELTIQPGCPWYEAQQSYGAPNVNWCEPTICSVINEPANTWSNLPYILVGLFFYQQARKSLVGAFGVMVILMGSFSFIYHMTNNFLTQFFDFVGMFLMMGFLMTFAIKRAFKNLSWSFYSLYWFLVFFNTALFMVFDIVNWPAQPMMLINAAPTIALDIFAGYKEKRLKDYKWFALTLVFLVAAQAFAILDIQRIWCEPDNLILHGHVIWHCLGAVAMFFAGLHIKTLSTEA